MNEFDEIMAKFEATMDEFDDIMADYEAEMTAFRTLIDGDVGQTEYDRVMNAYRTGGPAVQAGAD